MIENLEKLNKSRTTKRDFPCLFDDSNIQSVYGMIDPTSRGYITLKQYSEGKSIKLQCACEQTAILATVHVWIRPFIQV